MKHRAAVIGSGPSGMYAADALLSEGFAVDVFDKLPVPFGLVRYGVAPDHVSIRSVRDTLDEIWDKPDARFLGNVTVGKDVSIEELRAHYNAVVLTYGAASDRRLGIKGEDLPQSVAATDFVSWYTGHPEYQGPEFAALLPAVRSVAVIGVGNVAVDVVRVLSKSREELAGTDMPAHVLAVLDAAPIETVYLVGRRGPVQASFTTKELKELGQLADADVRLGSSDLELDPVSAAEVQESKVAARNLKVLQEWAAREPRTDAQRLIDLRFFSRPVAIEGDESVTGLRIERTALDASGRVVGTDKYDELAVDLVVRSVGYRGTPMPGVPFDAERNVIPNVDGRVVDGDTPVPGVYVAGWIKRGPSGIIGTNKKCAVATVAAIVADRESGALPGRDNDMDIAQMLANRGVEVVPIEGWRAIDREERSRGLADGRDRVTIDDHRELVRLGTSGATPAT